MSNSVVFLLIAVGLSLLGTFVVWLHGRPRRSKSSVDVFNRSLRALATNETQYEQLSGVTVRPVVDDDTDDDDMPAPSADVDGAASPTARPPKPSPRPSPRPAAPRRPRPSREGAGPGT
jgi:hypothetical protein